MYSISSRIPIFFGIEYKRFALPDYISGYTNSTQYNSTFLWLFNFLSHLFYYLIYLLNDVVCNMIICCGMGHSSLKLSFNEYTILPLHFYFAECRRGHCGRISSRRCTFSNQEGIWLVCQDILACLLINLCGILIIYIYTEIKSLY